MHKITVGSVCSGIEAASVAWRDLNFNFKWFSEIAEFPSRLLKEKYPTIPNLGDMSDIPNHLKNNACEAPDLICGGTPCQAFSLAGWKNGLDDERGNLTLKFVEIVEQNDKIRITENKKPTIVFWENVEGVLSDKTNAFGSFVSSLAGLTNVIDIKKWPNSGILRGPNRNIAWRVLDAKYFGLPQQRKRLYLLAGGKDFFPENILFEKSTDNTFFYPKENLTFNKDNSSFQVFREYTDCLYSAYGTKWNGNAAAYNGSLFVVQDNKLRRFSPLETERLMGFPDNYTNLCNAKKTNRYKAIGNSWAVPVVRWLGERLSKYSYDTYKISGDEYMLTSQIHRLHKGLFIDFGKDIINLTDSLTLNCSSVPEAPQFNSIKYILSADAPSDIYISPVGCYGIIRRKTERNIKINAQLEKVLLNISSQMPKDEIEKRSRVQKRGRFSDNCNTHMPNSENNLQMSLYNL